MTIELYTQKDLQDMYNNININFEPIYYKYGYILNEDINSVTRSFILEGYDNITAYKLSFMFTFLITVETNSL